MGDCPTCKEPYAWIKGKYGPTCECDHWWRDILASHTDISFSWKDRLRLLFSGKARVSLFTRCEHAPGRVEVDPATILVYGSRRR